MLPSGIEISLHIRAARPEFSMGTQWVAKGPAILRGGGGGLKYCDQCDQTVWMFKLICIFAVRTCQRVANTVKPKTANQISTQ